MDKSKFLWGACSSALALIAATGHANAQAQAPAAQPGHALEEVIVTANRRSENLQNVPTAVTALTASALAHSNITSTTDLSQAVPGLDITVANGWAEPFIRGVGTTANSTGLESPIALYVDGVYYANPTGGVFSLSSVQGVEVDKGPQGTLFGRNATGGVVQITTRDPGDTPRLDLSVGLDNYLTVTPDIYVSGPVTDNLDAGLNVHLSNQDEGYGKNLYPGNDKDVYKTRELDIRNKWLWTPTSHDRVTLSVDYTNLNTSAIALRFQPGTIPFGYPLTQAFTYSNPWDVYSDVQPRQTLQQGGASIKEEHTFSFAKFTSLTAYRDTWNNTIFDFGTPPFEIGASEHDRFEQFSQEFQLSSLSTSPLRWTVGAFYIDETAAVQPYIVYGTLLPASNIYYATRRTESEAVFGQATYEVLPKTDLTVGLRYTYENSDIHGTSVGVPITPASQDFGKLTWRLALDHHFNDDLMVYLSDNRGFRAGTYNAVIPTQPAIRPEQLDSYEVGLKSSLFDRRVRVNASAFLYEYDNIQVPIYQPAGIEVLNGASAELYGLDLDVEARPTSQLSVRAGLELLHSRFGSFPLAPINTPLTQFPYGNCSNCVGSAGGNQLPVAPQAVVDLGVSYRIPTNSGDFELSSNYQYNDGWFAGPDNIARQPSYSKVNAQIAWTSTDRRYEVDLFGKNLGDAAVASRLGSLFFGDIETLEPPRTFGAVFKLHY